MRVPTKNLVYIMCLISALFAFAEVILAIFIIPAALCANGAIAFFCIGMLFNIAICKEHKFTMLASVLALLLTLFSSIPIFLRLGLLAWSIFAIFTLQHDKKLVAYASIAVIATGIIMLISSFFTLSYFLAIFLLVTRVIVNTLYCVIMIKNKEIILND